MTETFNKYGFYKVNHTKFGGIIYPSDFDTNHKNTNNFYGSPIASRIVSDARFDKECKKYRKQSSSKTI